LKREARILVYTCSARTCAAAVIREYSIDSILLSSAASFCERLVGWSYMGEVRYMFSEEADYCELGFPPLMSGKNVKLAEAFYKFLKRLVKEVEGLQGGS